MFKITFCITLLILISPKVGVAFPCAGSFDLPVESIDPIQQILSLISKNINLTYQNEFDAMAAAPKMTNAGRAFRKSQIEYAQAHGDYVHYRKDSYKTKMESARLGMIRAWQQVERQGRVIDKTIKNHAKEQGINLDEKSISFSLGTDFNGDEINVDTSQLVFSNKGQHTFNRFADLLLKLKHNPVELAIQPSLVVQGIRGAYTGKQLLIEPNAILSESLSDQSIVHETMHLLLSEMVATSQIDPMWEFKFKSWTHLSRLPGDEKFYAHYMSVQELLTFGLTSIRAVYHLGELEDKISIRERRTRLNEAIEILSATSKVAKRIRSIARHIKDTRPRLDTFNIGNKPHIRGRISQYSSGTDDIRYDVLYPIKMKLKHNDDIPEKYTHDFFRSIDGVSKISQFFERISLLLLKKLKSERGFLPMSSGEFDRILDKIRGLNLPFSIDIFLSGF